MFRALSTLWSGEHNGDTGAPTLQETFVLDKGEYGIRLRTNTDEAVFVQVWARDIELEYSGSSIFATPCTARVYPRVEAIVLKPGATACIEVGALCVCATFTEVEYGDVTQNDIARFTVEFEVWRV